MQMTKQQGKKYTADQRAAIIDTLKPYLELGYDLKNACVMACQTYETIWRWVAADEVLKAKIKSWQNLVNVRARKNVVKEINNGDADRSAWWLERREKHDFSTRKEMTGAQGEPLIPEERKKQIDEKLNDYE